MKQQLSITLLLITLFSFAQNKFEPGYYIDNSNVKKECLIKNYDWKNNPDDIEIKNTQEDNSITKSILEIKEFAVYDKSKFVKATIRIDESSQNSFNLTNNPNPEFIEKTVLLKVLVEGNSNLYFFENSQYEKYFYSVNGNIEQLVYKQYENSEGNISLNESYKQQLFVNFKCNNDQKSIVALKYKNNDLIDYFIKTNNCISGKTDSKAITEKQKFQTNFKVNLLLSKINSTYEIPRGQSIRGSFESESRNVVSFGFEAEIILPYYNKKWSLIFDPSYIKNKESIKVYQPQFINPDNTLFNDSFTMRFPLGIRRYFKLNENNKLFTNLTYSFNINDTYTYNYNPFNNYTTILADDIFMTSNFALGFGYQYKRYSAEIKYNSKTPFYTLDLSGEEYNLNQISLKLGYKLF